MQKISCKNRRFLAFAWDQDLINFALWRQKIGNLLTQSGKLQRVDDCYYLEFAGKKIEKNFLVGVDVIGMEPALPHNGIRFYDYGPMSWDRHIFPGELPSTILELSQACSSHISNYSNDFSRIRICQQVIWKEDQLELKNYIDFIKIIDLV